MFRVSEYRIELAGTPCMLVARTDTCVIFVFRQGSSIDSSCYFLNASRATTYIFYYVLFGEAGLLEVVSDWSSQNITSCCKSTYIWRVSSRMCCPLAIKFDKAWIFEMKKERRKRERNVVLGLLSYSEPVSFFLLLSTRRRFINGLANHDD